MENGQPDQYLWLPKGMLTPPTVGPKEPCQGLIEPDRSLRERNTQWQVNFIFTGSFFLASFSVLLTRLLGFVLT